ncbi:immunity 8 family protein [Naumannella halotolerans]|uniref:immunity 8 family protein n=1 Tax=Naumannella halotolerans TaxID=993414 RepID=UPI00370DA568
MKASLRYFTSSDLDIETEIPDNPGDFMLLIRAVVGPDGDRGEESFDVEVCTPRWLARQVRGGPVVGRHLLIVDHYDIDEITGFLRRLIESVAAATWGEVAERVGRIGLWEFEDYRP